MTLKPQTGQQPATQILIKMNEQDQKKLIDEYKKNTAESERTTPCEYQRRIDECSKCPYNKNSVCIKSGIFTEAYAYRTKNICPEIESKAGRAIIRRARESDMAGVIKLLYQVEDVHRKGRPDLFKEGCRKYSDDELREIFSDDERPVFVRTDDDENVLGYAFCIFKHNHDDNVLTDITTLYIDDLCVDEKLRGQHIGKSLYEYVLDFARKSGCYNVTLNVWECNESARKFYDSCGLDVQKTTMEKIL